MTEQPILQHREIGAGCATDYMREGHGSKCVNVSADWVPFWLCLHSAFRIAMFRRFLQVTIGGGARVGGGNKKSSLAYQARAEERRAIVEKSARRRAENTAKIAELRRANSSSMNGIGFGGGSGFE